MFKNIKQKLKNKKGFTLVELIVVIVIILILAAVLVPNVLRYITNARQSRCQSEASSVLTELQADVASIYATSGDAMTDIQAIAAEASKDGAYTATPIASNTQIDTGDAFAFNVQTTTTADDYGTVTKFIYQDGTYYVIWDSSTGWGDITAYTATT